eukprot:TRINITY_DN8077_c0_g2_i1.p2 TRINITY_DN8077_c0_g2~~TRINITY_DN8077_c0_g2_i1.p2  ORF type:complete len:218 (-),score=-27.32 TRINITY_DN8077_c0_g2_i1:13-666(-)
MKPYSLTLFHRILFILFIIYCNHVSTQQGRVRSCDYLQFVQYFLHSNVVLHVVILQFDCIHGCIFNSDFYADSGVFILLGIKVVCYCMILVYYYVLRYLQSILQPRLSLYQVRSQLICSYMEKLFTGTQVGRQQDSYIILLFTNVGTQYRRLATCSLGHIRIAISFVVVLYVTQKNINNYIQYLRTVIFRQICFYKSNCISFQCESEPVQILSLPRM